MKKIIILLIIKTLWRIPATLIFFMPLIAPVLAYNSGQWVWLGLVLINPILLARKTTANTTHFNQPDVQRYRLPKWLEWMETPDEHLPGGLYEPTHKKIYDMFGWFVASMYWLLLRNVGGGITWGEGIYVGAIYDKRIDHNSEIVLDAVAAQAILDNGLEPGWFVKWELTKDFYGTRSGRADEDWRTCGYVAKPEITTTGGLIVMAVVSICVWLAM